MKIYSYAKLLPNFRTTTPRFAKVFRPIVILRFHQYDGAITLQRVLFWGGGVATPLFLFRFPRRVVLKSCLLIFSSYCWSNLSYCSEFKCKFLYRQQKTTNFKFATLSPAMWMPSSNLIMLYYSRGALFPQYILHRISFKLS